MKATEDTTRNSTSIRGSISKMNYQNSMVFVETISKYSVLACVALLSTMITVVLSGLRYFSGKNNKTGDVYIFYTYLLALSIVVDSMINVICLKWQFSFWANQEYFRFCHCCHSIAKNIVIRSSDMPPKPDENKNETRIGLRVVCSKERNVPRLSTSVAGAVPSASANEIDR